MKTLLIIRHAKAVQTFGRDKNRELTERGHSDAVTMAETLLQKGYTIDKIFCSPSVRTMQTMKHFAHIHHVAHDDIKIFDNLYLGDTLAIEEAVEWLRENINTLAVIAHNPGVTNFTKDVTDSDIDSLPTSGIAIIEVDMNDWENFKAAKKNLAEVISPKTI